MAQYLNAYFGDSLPQSALDAVAGVCFFKGFQDVVL
jgi:hypothetical protein